MQEIVQKAIKFASRKHGKANHTRKYTGMPYILHPMSVAQMVSDLPNSTPEMVAAAWLHDTVEDTNATIEDIRNKFGVIVSAYVYMLTDVSKPEDGNRAVRKEMDRIHLSSAHPEAKTIKLADLIDNSRSIITHDPRFARVYMKEKEALLEVLKEGDAKLYKIAVAIVATYNATKDL